MPRGRRNIVLGISWDDTKLGSPARVAVAALPVAGTAGRVRTAWLALLAGVLLVQMAAAVGAVLTGN